MSQVRYLFEYLNKEWQPKTLVIEDHYVDGDYLVDYTSFYATSYARFDRFCKRVHFFIEDFSEEKFEQYLLREVEDEEQAAFETSYLGFSVIRPLPQAIIGRTLLRTYAARSGDDEQRYYRAVDDYHANLFGLKLTIAQTLPFQQQDSVVAACATVALWSAFHKTARLFGTSAPRPAKITSNATANIFQERVFPSTGLTLEQICDAIRANELEPEPFRFDSHQDVPLLSWLRAYLDFGIPLIVGVKIPRDGVDPSADAEETSQESDAPAVTSASTKAPCGKDAERAPDVARHAVTVVGYRASVKPARERETKGDAYDVPSFGRRIIELYCHDDNLGAFAAYDVVTDSEGNLRLSCEDYGKHNLIEIDSVIAPVYHKIRLPFPEIHKWISVLDNALVGLLEDEAYAQREWDVRLISNEHFKNEMRQIKASRSDRIDLVTSSEPRFLWSAVLMSAGEQVIRLHADATSIARSIPIRQVRFRSDPLRKNVVQILKSSTMPEGRRLWRYLAEGESAPESPPN